MWQTWTRAKTYGKTPHEIHDPSGATWDVPYGSLALWMFETAVTWFGITIENALQERVKVRMGKDVEYKPKYTLARLLNQNFRLPTPTPEPEEGSVNPWSAFLGFLGKRNSGVKRYQYVKKH